MIDWTEDNFLERLMPQLRQKFGGATGPCPDAETLCAVIEEETPEPQRVTIIEHLSQCPGCADLRSRLVNFESLSSPEPEAVWNQTRTRLDNWLEGLLRSEAANIPASIGRKPSGSASGWENISNFFTSGKIAWALGAAVVLFLVVDGVRLLEHSRERLDEVEVRITVPLKPPEKGPEQPGITPREQGAPKVGEPNAPGAPALPSASPERHLETAQVTSPPSPNPAAGPVAPPTAPALSNPTASALPGPTAPAPKSLPAPASPPQNPAPAAAIGHPPTIWLDPAGRLLVVVSSIRGMPDGRFQFHGVLLLPVAQPGPVPLDRGAEVIGVGTKSHGQISLAVTELVVQGVHYTLKKDGSGEMNAQTPGAGGGVHFDRSQVLEMWPAATAVYEKAPAQTGQPEPQK